MQERRRNKRDSTVIDQTDAHPPAADIDDLCGETCVRTGFILQEARVQPVSNVTFRHAVQAAAIGHLQRGVLLRTGNGFTFDNRFQQTVVDHIAILTDRRCPGGVSFEAKTKVRARFGADFSEGLEATNAAVQEARRLRVQLAAKLAEARQRQHFFRINVHIVSLQQGRQRFGIRRIKPGVDVVNAKAQPVAQHACGADVGGNHRLFNDAVRNASRFGHDVQHFAFLAQNKAIIRAVFEHQRMGFTPLAAVQADAMQQADLRGNGV